MELKRYLVFLLLFLAFAGCSKDKSSEDDKIIAKIGDNYEITVSDLKQYVADRNYIRRFRNKSNAYKNALNVLITNQLKRFDFFDRKLNENQDLMEKIRPAINYALINTYFDTEFVEKYVNEKNAEKAYKQMDKQVIINDILLPIPKNPSKEKIDSLKTLALQVEKELIRNNDINEIREEYSLKNPVISIKNISWLQSMSDPVAHVAFKQQKGSTQVVQSYDGFHIIKVMEIKKIKLEPFDEMKDKILSELKKGYYQVYNNEYDSFRYSFIDKNSIKWNQRGLDKIVKWSKINNFYGGAYKDTIKNAILNGDNFEILSFNNGKVDLKDFLRLLEEVAIVTPRTIVNSVNVKNFILDAVYDDNVVKAAKKIGLEKGLINPYTKDKIVKDRIVYLYNKAVIEESIPKPTPEALKTFYEDHRDSIFYQLKKINLYARIYSDSIKAVEDINEIKKGTPFEKVSNTWFVKTYIRERDGSLNSYRSQEPPYLAKAGFKLGLNEAAGPVEYYDSTKGKQFAVIKCIRIRPEKQLTYDDVKGKRIVEEFRNFYRQKISDDLVVKLRQKYGVKIFEDELSKAIESK